MCNAKSLIAVNVNCINQRVCVTTTEGRQARLWNSIVPHNQVFPYFEILFFYLKLCIAKFSES